MPSFDQLLARRDALLAAAARHGADHIRVFGSVARNEATAQSDVDFLVKMQAGRSLLDLAGLQQDLEDLLGCRTDVVTENGLHPMLRERVLTEAREI